MPVLLAFAIFALLAAAFLIANIVSGVVLTSYRDIGVMKAVGYTPGQVSLILAGQVLAPAILGSVVGVVIGTIASQPVIHDTAESFGLPTVYALSASVVVAVLGVALATCLLAAVVPAVRAGRISPVAAMTRGVAPSLRADGGRLRRLGLALPVGLPGRLGMSAGLAHPVRASMMLGALVVGVAAATFALGLNWSLLQVMTDLNRDAASPIRVEAMGAEGGGGKVQAVPLPAGGAPGAAGAAGNPAPADRPRHVRHRRARRHRALGGHRADRTSTSRAWPPSRSSATTATRAGSATRSSRDAGSPGPARSSHRPTSSRCPGSTSATPRP